MNKYNNVLEYIEANWNNVIRECKTDKGDLVGVPYPFTVPAVDCFESLYYWDTYFTNIGLLLSGRETLAKNNTDNILYLVEKFGFMPNSNGTYHLDHSQPPFLSIMVKDIYSYYNDKAWLFDAYKALIKEYNYWMKERSTPIGLNRYDTNSTDSKNLSEKGKDFIKRIRITPQTDTEKLGRHYLGTCESGFDCSSRFGFEIYNYAPVCLNSLMYAFESNMAYFAQELELSESEIKAWLERSEKRKALMKKYMLGDDGCFYDYNFMENKRGTDFSAAAIYPLYCGVADSDDAQNLASNLHRIEADYGILSSEQNSFDGNYQWGYPNCWAPHQIIAIKALDKYCYGEQAKAIAQKFITLADKVFACTNELWEKYNAIEGNINVKCEYNRDMPPMMGWTASAYLYAKNYISKI